MTRNSHNANGVVVAVTDVQNGGGRRKSSGVVETRVAPNAVCKTAACACPIAAASILSYRIAAHIHFHHDVIIGAGDEQHAWVRRTFHHAGGPIQQPAGGPDGRNDGAIREERRSSDDCGGNVNRRSKEQHSDQHGAAGEGGLARGGSCGGALAKNLTLYNNLRKEIDEGYKMAGAAAAGKGQTKRRHRTRARRREGALRQRADSVRRRSPRATKRGWKYTAACSQRTAKLRRQTHSHTAAQSGEEMQQRARRPGA